MIESNLTVLPECTGVWWLRIDLNIRFLHLLVFDTYLNCFIFSSHQPKATIAESDTAAFPGKVKYRRYQKFEQGDDPYVSGNPG